MYCKETNNSINDSINYQAGKNRVYFTRRSLKDSNDILVLCHAPDN